MKTIFLGYHDIEKFVDKKDNLKYRIKFSCPYCNQVDYVILKETKGQFYHTCEDCGQEFKVDYEDV